MKVRIYPCALLRGWIMKRYLENKLRENFDLEGTPIIIQFKNRGEE